MKPVQSLLSVAVLALLLPGCALIGGSPPPLDTYELTAPRMDEGRRRGGVQILVAEPSALKAVDGQNIVIKTGPGNIQYLKGAQWADRLPKVVQARLAEAYQLSGRFGGVGKPGEGLAIDYQIIVDIRAFEVQVVSGAEQAYAEFYVRILNDRNGTVRVSRTFEASAPISGTGNDAYVNGLDAAFGSVARDIVDWTSRSI